MFVFCLVSVFILFRETGCQSFTTSTTTPVVKVKENQGAVLQCSYTSDFGSSPRIEWKFKDLKGSQSLVVFDGKPTTQYAGRVTLGTGGLTFNQVTRVDNGDYDCEVSNDGHYSEAKIKLIVLVAPSVPVCRIPTSVTTGTRVLLTCFDAAGSPPSVYAWYKDNVLLNEDPNTNVNFKNLTYKLSNVHGILEFPHVSKMESGSYYCQASNEAGPSQSCAPVTMEVHDLNTGGIVAGVIVAFLAVALLAFGLWYAYRRGYLPKASDSKSKSKIVYAQPASEHADSGNGEFRQKSSFVV